ncbi:hypothetical protein BKA24_000862 [Microbacterium marinum]|uniref:Uncharacterized protein n=1 Tax=Microbacterium marinum TaxID=421115 RepID=A0A7W7BR55_9MICO|nr:hypothetical protein [Microbacterium marinum]MBB4666153.1 hypothetical protein [Microbacterium marinum]
MSTTVPDSPAPLRRRRALVIGLTASIAVAALVVVAAIASVSGQGDRPAAVSITSSIDGEPVDLQPVNVDDAQMAALTELSPHRYLAMPPFVIANDDVRPGAVRLDLELPESVPDGVFVTFAYLDITIDEWMPVATRLDADGRTIVAELPAYGSADGGGIAPTVTTASLRSRAVPTNMPFDPATQIWTAVVGGLDTAVDAVGEAIGDAGAAVVDVVDAAGEEWDRAIAEWGEDFTLGSQWLMRAERDLLGTGVDAPTCQPDTDGAVPWVADTLLSDNAMIVGLGIEGGNAAVLLCVGPDPDDPSMLQVRAAANRSYGFPVTLADGIVASSAGMDALDPSASVLIGAAYSAIAGNVDLLLNPGAFILPGQTFSFTVDESTVRASHELTASDRVVEYPLAAFPQVLLSGFLGAALEELDPEDMFAGALGVFFLARDCDFSQWEAGTQWAELVGSVSTCVETLDSDSLQNAALEVARSTEVPSSGAVDLADDVKAADAAKAAKTADAFVAGGAEKARKVIGKLKWLALFAAVQTVSDYIADVGSEELSELPAWFANVTTTAAPVASWEDVADTWCGVTAPCIELEPGTSQTDWGTSTLDFDRMMGECFAGIESGDPGSGANVVYCPAGVATPDDIPGSDVGLPPADDDSAFDRVFIYQGYGTFAWFRQADLLAVKGS